MAQEQFQWIPYYCGNIMQVLYSKLLAPLYIYYVICFASSVSYKADYISLVVFWVLEDFSSKFH